MNILNNTIIKMILIFHYTLQVSTYLTVYLADIKFLECRVLQENKRELHTLSIHFLLTLFYLKICIKICFIIFYLIILTSM